MEAMSACEHMGLPAGYRLTEHARRRMVTRGVSYLALCAVIYFGRTANVRGAEILAIGRNEVRSCSQEGIDITRYEGIQIVCHEDGSIMTVYRNKRLRGLRR